MHTSKKAGTLMYVYRPICLGCCVHVSFSIFNVQVQRRQQNERKKKPISVIRLWHGKMYTA